MFGASVSAYKNTIFQISPSIFGLTEKGCEIQ